MRHQLVVLLAISFYTNAEEFPVNPSASYVWRMTNFTGKCVKIPAKNLAQDKSLYEGRWYVVGVSYVPEEAKTLSCLSWDIFFDKKGLLHESFKALRNGKPVHVALTSQPVDAEHGIYDFEAKHKGWANVYNTLYYVDDKVQFRWYIQCLENGIEHRQVLVAYRDLKYVNELADFVRELTTEIEAIGGTIDKTFVGHENCKYPPEFKKNPFL